MCAWGEAEEYDTGATRKKKKEKKNLRKHKAPPKALTNECEWAGRRWLRIYTTSTPESLVQCVPGAAGKGLRI